MFLYFGDDGDDNDDYDEEKAVDFSLYQWLSTVFINIHFRIRKM